MPRTRFYRPRPPQHRGTNLLAEREGLGLKSEAPDSAPLIDADGLPESIDPPTPDANENDDDDQPFQSDEHQPVLIDGTRVASPDVPAFLQRSFGSKGQEPERKSLQLGNLRAFIAENRRFVAGAYLPEHGVKNDSA